MQRMTHLLLATTLVAGLATSAMAREFVFAHGENPGNPRYDAANMFAELVASYSGGAWSVNVAPAATMGNDAEMITSVTAGIIEMTANSQGAFSQVVAEAGALGLPFLFTSLPEAWAVLDGPIGEEIDRLAQDRGMKVVGFWDNGIRHISHVERAIRNPEDARGMTIRTPPDRATIDAFNALGANPAPLAWSEVPTALRNRTFEAQENPLTNIFFAGIHEITPHISLSAHKYESTPVIANLAWWNGLSDAERDVISRAVRDAGWYQRGRSLIDNEKLKDTMRAAGVTFYEVDTEALQAATASVYDKWEEELGDFVSRLLAEVRGQ